MQLSSTTVIAAFAIAFASSADAAIHIPYSMFTTDADIVASGTNVTGTAGPLGPTASPLPEIRTFSAPGTSTGVFTNQWSGAAGVTGGDIRTVTAAQIFSATDTDTFMPVYGPTGGALAVFAGLEGTLTGTGSVAFTEGKLIIAEVGAGFDRRNPSSWGFPGTTLGEFSMAFTNVLEGPTGATVGLGGEIPASLINTSNIDAFNPVIGNTSFNFLFAETLPGFFDSITNPFSNPDPEEGLWVGGNQLLDTNAVGLDMNTNSALNPLLDPADLLVLNSIAGAAGLSDLVGVGTAFATGLGASSVSPTTDFFADPSGLATASGEGDLHATLEAFTLRPVIEGVPEPTTFVVWGALASLAGVAVTRRRQIA